MTKHGFVLPFAFLAVPLLAFHVEAQEWTKFSSAEGRFSILMPAKATSGISDAQSGNIKVTAHHFTALSQSIDVMCGYYDFPSAPSDPEKVFDATREGSIKNVHGTLLTEKKLAKDGYPGRRFRSTGIGTVFLDEEMFLVGQRFYLITLTTTAKTPNASIEKVFDSFHFSTSH